MADEPLVNSREGAPCTCAVADGRHWCLRHDTAWPDTTEELIEAMHDAAMRDDDD